MKLSRGVGLSMCSSNKYPKLWILWIPRIQISGYLLPLNLALGCCCFYAHERTRHAPQDAAHVVGPRARLAALWSLLSPRRVSRKTAALRRQSCGTEGTRVLDLGPRSHCRAGLSFAADARAYSELGSHAKTGLRARRAPRIGRRAPTANEAAPRDRAAIARRIGAPAEKRARAAAARRRGWLQSALREPEHRPRSRGHRA